MRVHTACALDCLLTMQHIMPDDRADMSFSDTASIRSDRTESSVVSQKGHMGDLLFLSPGSVTQTGLFGQVKHYKEGSCIHGGFFSKTKYVTSDGMRSPYVTPTSSPEDYSTPGNGVPPAMKM